LKCDGTRAETRFRLSPKRTSPFKSAGASVQSTTGSRAVRISGNNAGYTMFRGSVKSTGYPLYSPVSPLLPLPCVTVCHHISTGLYQQQVSELGTLSVFSEQKRKFDKWIIGAVNKLTLTNRAVLFHFVHIYSKYCDLPRNKNLIFCTLFGPTRSNDGYWRIKSNREINDILKGQSIIGFIKKQTLKWLGHVERMAEDYNVQKIKRWKPMSKRPIGRPE